MRGLAEEYTRPIVRLHDVPRTIVSDRDGRFTSKFWGSRFRLPGDEFTLYYCVSSSERWSINENPSDIGDYVTSLCVGLGTVWTEMSYTVMPG